MYYFGVYQATVAEVDLDRADAMIRGAKWACVVFLIYCWTHLQDGAFVRPHPGMWRLVSGILILYLLFLTFLLFLSTEDARMVLSHLENGVGKPLPFRDYGTDCRVFTPEKEHLFQNIYDTFWDEFVIAHLFGWIVKGIMFRDFYVLTVLSVLFEVMEYTFTHWLPNFNECWWDHWIIDVLVCNGLGMWIGLKLCDYFSMKSYDWTSPQSKPKTEGVLPGKLRQLGPKKFDSYNWGYFRTAKRFAAVTLMVMFVMLVELNAFFLKTVLYIPPPKTINIVRLAIWATAAIPAIREFYQYVTDPHMKVFGTSCWLMGFVGLTECLVVLRHGKGRFTAPFPTWVLCMWALIVVSWLSFFVYFFFIRRMLRKRRNSAKVHTPHPTNSKTRKRT